MGDFIYCIDRFNELLVTNPLLELYSLIRLQESVILIAYISPETGTLPVFLLGKPTFRILHMITLEASSLQISFVVWCSDQPF
jgi:hypothetical protein